MCYRAKQVATMNSVPSPLRRAKMVLRYTMLWGAFDCIS